MMCLASILSIYNAYGVSVRVAGSWSTGYFNRGYRYEPIFDYSPMKIDDDKTKQNSMRISLITNRSTESLPYSTIKHVVILFLTLKFICFCFSCLFIGQHHNGGEICNPWITFHVVHCMSLNHWFVIFYCLKYSSKFFLMNPKIDLSA